MNLITTILVACIVCLSCSTPTSQQAESQTAKVPDPNYDPEKNLAALELELPEVSSPVANYVNATRVGNIIFLAGKGPNLPEGGFITGKVGDDLSVEEGYEAARLTGLQQLAVLKQELGNLNKVKRVLKVLGMVNASPDFTDHPEVINGFSDLMVDVFGEKGKHARAAVGMGSLPRNIAVEIEAIVEVYD